MLSIFQRAQGSVYFMIPVSSFSPVNFLNKMARKKSFTRVRRCLSSPHAPICSYFSFSSAGFFRSFTEYHSLEWNYGVLSASFLPGYDGQSENVTARPESRNAAHEKLFWKSRSCNAACLLADHNWSGEDIGSEARPESPWSLPQRSRPPKQPSW